jgi:hypothetical protein
MKRLRRIFLLTIAATALVLLFAACVLWIHSRNNVDHAQFSGSQQSVYLESSAKNGLLLRVTDLTPTITARVTGMTDTPNGWVVSPGQTVTMRLAELPAGTTGTPTPPNGVNADPLSISRPKLQFHGLVWSSGFSAQHATLPGPFPACQVDTFTLTYTTAFVVLILTTLIAGYFGRRAAGQFVEGQCQSCGSYLPAGADRCPQCGTIPQSPNATPSSTKHN